MLVFFSTILNIFIYISFEKILFFLLRWSLWWMMRVMERGSWIYMEKFYRFYAKDSVFNTFFLSTLNLIVIGTSDRWRQCDCAYWRFNLLILLKLGLNQVVLFITLCAYTSRSVLKMFPIGWAACAFSDWFLSYCDAPSVGRILTTPKFACFAICAFYCIVN